MGTGSKIKRIWVGQEEEPVNGRSVQQCLAEMDQQGWTFICSRATADFHGVVCEYDFQRPIPAPQSADPARKISAHTPSTH